MSRNESGATGPVRSWFPRMFGSAWTLPLFVMAQVFLTGIDACTMDGDNDGYGSDVDCDDTDPNIHPNALEECNGIDDNCDGAVDEGLELYRDNDMDTYGDPSSPAPCDAGEGYVPDNTDCNDKNGKVNPGAPEVPGNGLDDNCNGTVDEGGALEHPVQSAVGNTTLQDLSGYTNLTAGFLFAPTVDGSLTQVGLRIRTAGTYTVSFWDDKTQALLGQADVSADTNSYTYTSIKPIFIKANQQIRIGVYIPSSNIYWSLTTSSYQITVGHITFLNDIYGYGGKGVFPPSSDGSHRLYGLCDLGFQAAN